MPKSRNSKNAVKTRRESAMARLQDHVKSEEHESGAQAKHEAEIRILQERCR